MNDIHLIKIIDLAYRIYPMIAESIIKKVISEGGQYDIPEADMWRFLCFSPLRRGFSIAEAKINRYGVHIEILPLYGGSWIDRISVNVFVDNRNHGRLLNSVLIYVRSFVKSQRSHIVRNDADFERYYNKMKNNYGTD